MHYKDVTMVLITQVHVQYRYVAMVLITHVPMHYKYVVMALVATNKLTGVTGHE